MRRQRTCKVRSRTAVRASGHAHNDRVVPQTIVLADLLNLVDEDRQVLQCLSEDVPGLRRARLLTLSDSAIASPHVGNATHAELDNLNALWFKLSNLYFFRSSLI